MIYDRNKLQREIQKTLADYYARVSLLSLQGELKIKIQNEIDLGLAETIMVDIQRATGHSLRLHDINKDIISYHILDNGKTCNINLY